MRRAFDAKLAEQLLGDFGVNPRRFEQFLTEFTTELGHTTVKFQSAPFEQDLARQGIAVTVQSAGRNADQNIARNDRRRIDNPLFLQNPDDEAGEIVLAFGKIAGMLGSLAADQAHSQPGGSRRRYRASLLR